MEMYFISVLIQHIDVIGKIAVYLLKVLMEHIHHRDAGEAFQFLIRKKEMYENDKP
jgi:hypothetical protein